MASRRGFGIGSLCVELLGLSNSGVDNNLSTFFEWRLSTCDSNSQRIQPDVVRYVSLDLCLLLLRLLVRSYVKGELIGKYVA
jgi:hypothetical protein